RAEHLQLDRARAQVVEALLGDEPEEVARRRPGVRLRDLPAGEVAAPHVHDLASGDELLHRLPDLVPGCLPVDVVHLVEVDAVGLQAAEALVARAPDVVRGEPRVVRPLAHRGIDLGGEDDRLAAAAALREPAADDLLGDALAAAPAVDVRRVEEVDAGLARAVHEREAFALAGERAEVHGPEAEAADAQPAAAEMDVLHGRVLARRDGPPYRPRSFESAAPASGERSEHGEIPPVLREVGALPRLDAHGKAGEAPADLRSLPGRVLERDSGREAAAGLQHLAERACRGAQPRVLARAAMRSRMRHQVRDAEALAALELGDQLVHRARAQGLDWR